MYIDPSIPLVQIISYRLPTYERDLHFVNFCRSRGLLTLLTSRPTRSNELIPWIGLAMSDFFRSNNFLRVRTDCIFNLRNKTVFRRNIIRC
jgi:hypothetical protein